MSTYLVKSLDQAKLLTDPFKLELLKRFAREPVTTKQVADRMGEKAPRLYRHVDALYDAGLLELVDEKPKRGTIERYYKTIAERFEVDPDLFSTGTQHRAEAAGMVRSLVRSTEEELLQFVRDADETMCDPATLPLIMRVVLRAPREDIERLRSKLKEWLDECEALAENAGDAEDDEAYNGFVAFYPVYEKPDAED